MRQFTFAALLLSVLVIATAAADEVDIDKSGTDAVAGVLPMAIGWVVGASVLMLHHSVCSALSPDTKKLCQIRSYTSFPLSSCTRSGLQLVFNVLAFSRWQLHSSRCSLVLVSSDS